MKLLGILLVVNSLVLALYCASTGHQHIKSIIAVCVLAAFIGIVFTMHDRAIEITFEKIGTIKAASEQATADANEIAEIRKRIEAQSATVDIVAQRANRTIEQLQNIALTSAEATITELMAASFFGGTTLETRLNLHDQIVASLREIGIEEEKISAIHKMWSKGVGIIYHRGIRNALEGRTHPNEINTKASPELLRASKEFQEMLSFDDWNAPSPDEMESFINERGFMNDRVRVLIEDYRCFLETGEIHRREVFITL